MRAVDLLRLAFGSLGRNRLRAALAMLGVVIGVASVVVMVAIGSGAAASVQASIERMGTNVLHVRPGSTFLAGISWGAAGAPTLAPEDAEAILRECPSVRLVSPVVRYGGQVIAGDRNWNPGTQEGVSEDYPSILGLRIVDGRWFDAVEVRSAAKVCVLGQTVARELFGDRSPVSATIRVGHVPTEVVGVIAPRGLDAWGHDLDDVIFFPWTTVQMRLARWAGHRAIRQITVATGSPAGVDRAAREITGLLRERHRIGPGREDDFHVRDMAQIAESFHETSRVLSYLLAAIASVSLLVGGIGIMNIMLVSVAERTREIGIRLAVGARGRDILSQFLAEAVALCAAGGLVGLALGAAGAAGVSRLAGWPVLLSAPACAVAAGFSLVVGVAFGFWPAWRASRLDPSACLRYE